MVQLQRLMKNLHDIGEIGKTGQHGITRLAFSKNYFEALNQLEKLCREKGYETHKDKVGNLFFTYNPSHAKDILLLGSHLDTVKEGGLYDGALGIFTALEVMDSLRESQVSLRHGITVVAFNAEEGSELGGTFGSRTVCGRNEYTEEFVEKLSKYHLSIDDLYDCKIDFTNIKVFLELHIEQGSVLDQKNFDLAVVDGIVGITRYDILLSGTANHAGTTPMAFRDDPMKNIPEVLNKLYETAHNYADPFVMTVGDIQVSPGMYNVIPSQVRIKVEVRDMDQKNIDSYFQEIRSFLEQSKIKYELIKNIEKPSVHLNKKIIKILLDVAKEKQFHFTILSSGAGHDAKELSHVVPTAMIFVPSVEGISHSPNEFTREKQIEIGANYLQDVVIKLDEVLS